MSEEVQEELPLERRLRNFKRSFWQAAGTLVVLLGVNLLLTPTVPWVIVAGIVFAIALVQQAAGLWADGASARDLFTRGAPLYAAREIKPPGERVLAARSSRDMQRRIRGGGIAAGAVPAGRGGATDRAMARAREQHAAIVATLGELSAADRQLVPDIRPTIDALLEQVLVLGDSLCRLDESVGATSEDEVRLRLATLDRESDHTGEWGRRRELLERQRVSVQELRQRQADLRTRFERATLLLENLRLDMLRLRSASVESAAEDVAGATQQARALSRDIRHALDAAAEVRTIR